MVVHFPAHGMFELDNPFYSGKKKLSAVVNHDLTLIGLVRIKDILEPLPLPIEMFR